jgi:hypothetical protein
VGVGTQVPLTHGQVIGCMHGTRHATMAGRGAVAGWQAPQQVPTPSA